MRTDLSGSLIRMIFTSGLTPDITGQLSLAVLMCSLIKMNWIASKSVDFPAPFSPEIRVESPKSIVTSEKRCQLISFSLVSFFIF